MGTVTAIFLSIDSSPLFYYCIKQGYIPFMQRLYMILSTQLKSYAKHYFFFYSLSGWNIFADVYFFLMLQRLTGGVLLSRDSEFFVLYRGKDFLPLSVCSAIEERRKRGIHGEKAWNSVTTAQECKLRNAEGVSKNELDGANYEEKGGISEQRMLQSTEAVIKRTSIKLSMVWLVKAIQLAGFLSHFSCYSLYIIYIYFFS